MLPRQKGLGANSSELLDVYEKQVWSILEMGLPVDYKHSLDVLGCETKQREQICMKFSQNSLK